MNTGVWFTRGHERVLWDIQADRNYDPFNNDGSLTRVHKVGTVAGN
jgi:hypothetical protein